MLLWFAGVGFAVVWAVFRDTAIDYRLIIAAALLPDAVDVWLGGARIMHTLLFSVVLLAAVMIATRGRRSARRRLLALPIGTFVHLVLDGAWARTEVFWWPLLGSWAGAELPSFDRPAVVVLVQEAAGAAALLWGWGRFRLFEADRRRQFLRTGRFGRDLGPGPVHGPPGPAC